MYAVLPAFVSSVFLCYGLYVLLSVGVTRISTPFFLLCATTFGWQCTWVFLFPTEHTDVAALLAKLGYVFILPLPSTFYHFVAEAVERKREQRYVLASYGMSLLLMPLLLTTDWVVSGVHTYFFGDYPRAGSLLFVHVAQTVLLTLRSAWILIAARRCVDAEDRRPYDLCLVALALYSVAIVDYAANYGYAFYPPGVVFVALSLGILASSVVRPDLMHTGAPQSSTATKALPISPAAIHERARSAGRIWPEVLHGYRLAVDNGLCEGRIRSGELIGASGLMGAITSEQGDTSNVIDAVLTSFMKGGPDRSSFAPYRISECVSTALESYPFQAGERCLVDANEIDDAWRFVGSDKLLIYVLFNFLAALLNASRLLGDGTVKISAANEGAFHVLRLQRPHSGIPDDAILRNAMPSSDVGLGFPFCCRVIEWFGGSIECESIGGRCSAFTLMLPSFAPFGGAAAAYSLA